MALLLRSVVPEDRGEFERRFRDEVATAGDEELPDAARIGKTYA